MHAEIISIGDELISGQTLDTNSQWISRRLNELGIPVLFHVTVGDDLEANITVFREAFRRADIVVATGGLGPTADDLTRESLARATGRKLVRDNKTLEQIRQLFARRGRVMPKQNEVQAWFPEGSTVIANPHGTAPGIAMEIARDDATPCRLFALPGVPAELQEMWQETVAESLRALDTGGRVLCHRQIKCFGAGESQIEAMLPDLIRRDRVPRVGITASKTTITLRITADGATREECDAAMTPTVVTIQECLGDLVFGEDDVELEDVVVQLLRERKKTLAVAEWGTAGMVVHRLQSVTDAKGTIRGGIVVADNDALRDAIGVSPEKIGSFSSVSPEMADAMAVAVRERFHADYGLAISPFPEFDTAAAEPKHAYCALASVDGVRHKKIPFAGHPATLRIFCAKTALNMARLELMHHGG
jgi:nicotinamide-nucleotide amidase